MYQIAVCDDETISLDRVAKETENFFFKRGKEAKVTAYLNGLQLLETIKNGTNYDIVIMDIDMPEMTGMELARNIGEYCPETILIFITAFENYAIQSYELSIFRYIPKPSMETMLEPALTAAIQKRNKEDEEVYIAVKSGGICRIPYRDMQYLFKDGKNTVIVLEDGEEKIRKTLAQVYEELDKHRFFYVDRCYIVNFVQVKAIERNMAVLKNGKKLSISYARVEETKLRLADYWGRRLQS